MPLIEAGWDIVALVPSCALMLKFEWPLILPGDAAIERLARATFDVSEYVVDIARKAGDVEDPVAGARGLREAHPQLAAPHRGRVVLHALVEGVDASLQRAPLGGVGGVALGEHLRLLEARRLAADALGLVGALGLVLGALPHESL